MLRLIAALLAASVIAIPTAARGDVPGGPIAAPVTFVPKDGATLSIDGRGPFRGTLTVRRAGTGLTVINTLSIDDYVAGIREVPGSWPMEALKAQAVAARTYALWEMQKGHWSRFGFDVCATTDCQVYDGAIAEQGRNGRRWRDAVRETSGEVLLYQGKPALTRYHSSSGGRTLDNEDVFPSDGKRPYLTGTSDPQDRVSPLHRWHVDFSSEDLWKILHDGIGLRGTIESVFAERDKDKVTITTPNGRVDLTAVRFRRVVSDVAPRLFPGRYPAARNDGLRMPFTLPSSRFDITRISHGFRINGRGYGHGVGMSQWGAKGRADEGADYKRILGAYYDGLRPTEWKGSRTIRVAVERDAQNVGIFADGTFSVSTREDVLAGGTVGEWTVTKSGVRSISVQSPVGHQLPLVLTGLRVPAELVVDPPKSGETLDVSFVIPKSAVVEATVKLGARKVAHARDVFEAGERTLRIPIAEKGIAGRKRYRVLVQATDGEKRIDETRRVWMQQPGRPLWAKVFLFLAIVALVVAFQRRRVKVKRARRIR